MNLNLIFKNKKIKELTYDSVITERPMSNLVDFDYKTILSQPPANTSKTTEKELELVEYATKNRKSKEIQFIHRIDEDIDSFYISLLKKYDLDYPQKYINDFYSVVEPILMNTKSFWNRPRPRQLGKLYGIDIDVIETETIHTASYPSGHTVYSKLITNILSDIYPKSTNNFINIAKNTGIARIQQGVHYPSYNAASFIFSDYVYKKLKNSIT